MNRNIEIEMLRVLNDISKRNGYNGYIQNSTFAEVVCQFALRKRRPLSGATNETRPYVSDPFEYPIADEKDMKIVAEIIRRMVSKGVVVRSRKGNAVKPTVSAEEWEKRN